MKVELLDYTGGDLSHACSAWTSTSRDLTEEKIARIPTLLNMLAKNGHHTPFEKSYLHFLIEADTASHIHLLKHRIGVSVNAESARYKRLGPDRWHIPEDWPEPLKSELLAHCQKSYALYQEAITDLAIGDFSVGRIKESARFFLPYATSLALDVSFNFRSFMHFLKLRLAPDAQLEIRNIAGDMLSLVRATGSFDASLDAFGHKE
jgi:thymidylate synthase (FAD)